MDKMDQENKMFSTWAIVQVFGKEAFAGFLEEATIFNQGFARLTVPATSKWPEFVKLINPTSIFDISPVSEDYARRMAERYSKKPVKGWDAEQVLKEIAQDSVIKMSDQAFEKLISMRSEYAETVNAGHIMGPDDDDDEPNSEDWDGLEREEHLEF